MQTKFERPQVLACAEVFAFAATYVFISTTAASNLDAGFLFPQAWSAAERATGSGFLVGAVVQVTLVLVGAYVFRINDLRLGIGAAIKSSTRPAWIVAGIATAIHIGTALLFFLPQPGRVVETSALNLILSAAPAPDGWSQEVMFRGYVLFRLGRAGAPAIIQITLSGCLFAAIHFGYTGAGVWAFLSPLLGTFMLGCFYAWAVQLGRGSLKPVVCCHVLIIVITQPWLALAR